MSDNERYDIAGRLTKLEVSMKEKWEAHDSRAGERWVDLMDKFHEIGKKLDNRPCVEHERLLLGFNGRILALEKWMNIAGWAIGVVYIAVVGVIIGKLL